MANLEPNAVLRNLGRAVAAQRRQSGLTQEELAGRLGCSVKYLQRIEAGRQNLSVRSLVKLANVLEIEVADLFTVPDTAASL